MFACPRARERLDRQQPSSEATLFTKFSGLTSRSSSLLSPDVNRISSPTHPFGSDLAKLTDSSKVGTSLTRTRLPRALSARTQSHCPLLQSIGSQQGPSGGKALADVTFVQRLNTNGGSAPADGCSVAGDVGKQTLVPYTADYYFYHEGK